MEKYLQDNRLINRLFYLISFLFLVIFYGQVVWNDFGYIWDDEVIFIKNQSLVYDPLSWKLLTDPILDKTSYFRPTVLFSWWLEFHIFERIPAISHGINILVFYGSVLFLFNILKILFAQQKYGVLVSALATMIYISHPNHVEAVVWVSGRFDVFTAFLFLCSAFLMLKMPSSNFKTTILTLLYLLALGSKELAIFTLPFLFCIWGFKNHENGNLWKNTIQLFYKQNKHFIIAVISITILYLLMRKFILSGGFVHFIDEHNTFYRHIVIFWGNYIPVISLKEYLVETLFPFYNLGIYSPLDFFDGEDNQFKSIIVSVVFIFITLLTLFKRNKLFFIFSGYFMLISLVIYIIPLTTGGNITQDRFLHSPLIFYSILLAYFLCFILQKLDSVKGQLLNQKFTLSLYAIYSFSMSFITWELIPNWENNFTFWRAMSAYQEKYSGIHLSYYFSTLASYQGENVDKELKRLMEKEREYTRKTGIVRPEIEISYGIYLINKGEYEKGMELLDFYIETIETQPHLTIDNESYNLGLYTHYVKGLIFFKDDPEKALVYLKKGEKHLPKHKKVYLFHYLGVVAHLLQENYEQAKISFNDLLKIGGLNNEEEIKKMNTEIQDSCKKKPRDIRPCAVDFDASKILLN